MCALTPCGLMKQPSQLVIRLILAFKFVDRSVDLLRAGPLAQDHRLVRAIALNRAVFTLDVDPTIERSPKRNAVGVPGLNDLVAPGHYAHSSWAGGPNCD